MKIFEIVRIFNKYLRFNMLIVFLIVFISCEKNIKEGKELGIIGKTKNQVIAKYGNPKSTSKIIISRNRQLHEYQSSLYDCLGTYKKDSLSIVEMIFENKKNERKTAVWFILKNTQLTVIDALQWSKDINF